MSGIVDRLLSLPGWAVLLAAGLVVFAEDALFLGFLIPGESVALLAGVAASLGHVTLLGVLLVVVTAAVAGDFVGYEVGRHLGPRVLRLKAMQHRRRRLEDAQALLARRGGSAVLLGRWVAFFRAVMPFLAGAAQMRYRTFATWNAAGGITWGAAVVGLGYLAGSSYARVQTALGPVAAGAVAVIALAGFITWRLRRHRVARHRPPAAGAQAGAEPRPDRHGILS